MMDRRRMLLAHKHMPQSGMPEYQRVSNFLASVVACRVFLDFLGLKLDSSGEIRDRRNYQPDDVNVEDLGGQFVSACDLNDNQRQTFKQVLNDANKYVAHFTFEANRERQVTHLHYAVDLIEDLMCKHYWDRIGSKPPALEVVMATHN
ncbi:MAG: hypothetical protein HY650_11540 [Acidobacteria bacterium]|nr:hypothetical protein [Acidobacteriota bacterium]